MRERMAMARTSWPTDDRAGGSQMRRSESTKSGRARKPWMVYSSRLEGASLWEDPSKCEGNRRRLPLERGRADTRVWV